MSDKMCPNCGNLILPTDEYCSNCGLRVGPQSSGAKTLAKIASIVLLVVVGVPAALFGGCGLLFTFTAGFDPSAFLGLLCAALGLGLFSACCYWYWSVWKK